MSTDMYMDTRFRFNGYDMFIYNHPSNVNTYYMYESSCPINNPALLNARQ